MAKRATRSGKPSPQTEEQRVQEAYDKAQRLFDPQELPDFGYFDLPHAISVEEVRKSGAKGLKVRRDLHGWRPFQKATSSELDKAEKLFWNALKSRGVPSARHAQLKITHAKPLCFYQNAWLLHAVDASTEWVTPAQQIAEHNRAIRAVVLLNDTARKQGEQVVIMDGTSPPIHRMNGHSIGWGEDPEHSVNFAGLSFEAPARKGKSAAALAEDEKMRVAEYLTFFCEHVQGKEGGFFVVEDEFVEDKNAVPGADQTRIQLELSLEDKSYGRHLKTIARRNPVTGENEKNSDRMYDDRFDVFTKHEISHPVHVFDRNKAPSGEAIWPCAASMYYAEVAFQTHMEVRADGMIEMLDDLPLENVNLVPHGVLWSGELSRDHLSELAAQSADPAGAPGGSSA